MDYYSFLTYTITVSVILLLITYKYAFDKFGNTHCNNFVSNVYLYLALSICIAGLFIHLYNHLLNDEDQVDKLLELPVALKQTFPWIIGAVIMSFVGIFGMAFQGVFSKTGTIRNHIFWLIFLASISAVLYPTFKAREYADILQQVTLTVIAIFVGMSGIVYGFPHFFENTYSKVTVGLFIALLLVIITELVLTLTGSYDSNSRRYISYFVITLFSVYISYDTSRILQLARVCINSPNYPMISNTLFMDIINIFTRLLSVSSNE